ncbi:MAG TPA: 5-guanidino-2-oxopentanoate decarboxylase [Steroidobacteraceae bacterium]|nr:5-guanidino-2-oxopentanoate decarboxylase [Steroidobacteraceae bacterium]
MSITVGRYLVDSLAANDIDTAFGIPGVHTLELYRGLAQSSIRHVLVRHEQGAAFAADGYARATGRPAAAIVISGPGMTNTLTAVAQAYADSVPLLVIASTPPRASLGKQWGVLHELRNQHALAERVFGVARSARSAADVRDHLRACLASLRTGRPRPAYLEIPLDLLAENTDLAPERFAEPATSPAGATERIDAARLLLNAAERPLIVAGGGARGAAAELRRIAETLDALLVTTAAGKGVLPDGHAAHLGASLPYRETQELAASADVVLAVGTEIAETDIYWSTRLRLGGRMVRIDVDPAKLCDQYAAALPILGDARRTLAALERGLTRRTGWCAQIGGAAGVRTRLEAAWSPAARSLSVVLAAIRTALPADGAVFSDMTQIAYQGNYAFPVDLPGCWFHPSGYGTLGYALPAALGAKIASPQRAVLALAGDFGLQFTIQELMTAAEAQLALPIVVWNNAALGQIRDDMLAAHIPPIGVVARNPDFQALAGACAVRAARVTAAAELSSAVRTALAATGPTLIEVVETQTRD